MINFYPFKHLFSIKSGFLLLLLISIHGHLMAVTTSWIGATSAAWSTSTNWTNGVPSATVDVIIGDASFTGANQPTVSATATLKSLTLGNATKACTLNLISKRNITVYGNVIIGANGIVNHTTACSFSMTGNFTNAGKYLATSSKSRLIFSGSAAQLFSGGGTHDCRILTINSGSTTTLGANVSCSSFSVSGVFDPLLNLVTITSNNNFIIANSGTIKVNTANFSGNYSRNPSTVNNTSTVNYSSTIVNQTVLVLTYGKLVISGGPTLTKTLAGNITMLAATSSAGVVYLENGTLDLLTYTLNRGPSVAGGGFTILNGTTLKIGGTNTFPAIYASTTIGSTSTVEYYGGDQAVTSKQYGNLLLSETSSCTKILPSAMTTVTGNFTSTVYGGAMIINATGNMNILGNFTNGAGATFNASSFKDTIFGTSFINDGILNGQTGKFVMNGLAEVISGTGTYNFYDLEMRKAGITAVDALNFSVAGNFATNGSGTFTHTSGGVGTITFTGAGKTIGGSGIIFNNLAIDGSVSTTTSFGIAGNFSVGGGSFVASAGTISMRGIAKTITNSASLSFFAINIPSGGVITTSSTFFIKSDLSVAGSLTASAGTITFSGNSILSGTANLFTVILNGPSLTMGNNSVLGIASTFSLGAGTFDVQTSTPNTVDYNGVANQNIAVNGYNRLKISGSGIKTAATGLTINENISIASGATFAGGTFTHFLQGDWTNNGTFTPSTSTITLNGTSDAYINGTSTTTFNNLTINKSLDFLVIYMNTNTNVGTITMTLGTVRTGTTTLTITTTRSGAGYIYGIIKRTHTFLVNTAYAFEGLFNTITFTAGTMPTSVTVEVATDPVAGFPYVSSANRLYNISVTGTGYTATVRLHYLQGELNGNNEALMNFWRFITGSWGNVIKTTNSTSEDWLELTGVADITNKWTFSETSNVAGWTGAISADWGTSGNWANLQGTPSLPPSATDVVVFGNGIYTRQPTLGTVTSIQGIQFQSNTPTNLTLNGSGSLTMTGSIGGTWSSDATHNINLGDRTLFINGDLALGDGTANHNINLNVNSGAITVKNALTQTSGSIIDITGAATVNVGTDFTKTSTGAFNCGTSTFTYDGALSQQVAGVTYRNLSFNKLGGAAALSTAAIVNGNMNMTGNTSQFDINASLSVAGNFSFGALNTVNGNSSNISVGGNWSQAGTFIQGGSNLTFNGAAAQTISASNFNNVIINKASNSATLTGNVGMNGDLTISSGTLDLGTNICNRTAVGGILTLGSLAILKVGGASNFPSNFDTRVIPSTSTVNYNGTVAQSVRAINYGNLYFTNGSTANKTLAGTVTVLGDLKINSSSTLDASAYTIDIYKNWIDSGKFVPSTSTVKFSGGLDTNTIYGKNSFYNVLVTGNYKTTTGTVIILLNNFTNAFGATYTQYSDSSYFYGNFFNYGTIGANGITNFMGTKVQNISNNGTVTSTATGVINYQGTVSPIITSTGSGNFYTLNISNTSLEGINPTVPWNVYGTFSIGSGSTFNGGGLVHTFLGNFYNNGTMNSSGTLVFNPLFGPIAITLGTIFNSSGLVNFTGGNAITITGSTSPTFGAVQVANTNSAGITPSSNWIVNGSFTILSGATFNGNSGISGKQLSVAGNFTNNGAFYGKNSTVTMTNEASITGTSAITQFNNLIISALDTALIDFSVSGNFTNNGTFVSEGFETTFIGANPSIIGGSADSVNFYDLTFSKTNGTVTLSKPVKVEKDIIINSGTQVLINTNLIEVAGNWTNHGSYQDSTSTTFATANFNGLGAQIISGLKPTNFGNFTINNVNGITVSSPQTVNGVLKLTSGSINSGGFLKLNLNKGAIASTGVGTITGNIVTSKSIPSEGYHYISSPLSGRSVAEWHDNLPLASIAPSQNYHFYNETNTSPNKSLGWTPITSTSDLLTEIKGFALYFPNATTTMDMVGTYNHANTSYSSVPLTLTRSTPADNGSDGWNLVGNPFPSPLDWDASSGWTKTNVYAAIYCWDPTNNRYTSYIGALGSNGGSKYIPAMQAFWVRLDTTGTSNKTGALNIANGARVTSVFSTPIIWRTAAKQNILKLTATNEYNFDETIIRFIDSATVNFDGMLDAYKMPSEGNTPNFFSAFNGNQYSINTLPLLGYDFSLPLPLSAAKSGKMSIAAEQLGAIDDNISVVLYDKVKNVSQDLKVNPLYKFDYDHTNTSTRFYLNMLPTITALEERNNPTIQILEFNKTLTINFDLVEEITSTIKLVDVLGRVVFETNEFDPANKKYQKDLSALLPGVYMVEVATHQKKTSSRILLR